MTPRELTKAQQRLTAFAAEVFGSFGRVDQRRWGERYVRGLLGAGRRKSMEPMAARLGVDRQGLQQFLADAPWSHRMVLAELAWKMEPVIRPAAWVVDDVSFPKDGHASPGVAAQYCGAWGKTANCQVAPSVHLVTDAASCPVNWRLFLPAEWDPETAEEPENAVLRRRRARVPEETGHVEKWRLAVDMVDELRCWGLDPPLVVADEGYGQDGAFRLALTERGIPYTVGVRSDTVVLPETAQRTALVRSGTGRKPVPRYRDRPVSVHDLVAAGGRGGPAPGDLAAGLQGAAALVLRRPAGPAGRGAAVPGALWAGPAGVPAAGRVAGRRGGAGQVLAVHPARPHPAAAPGALGEDPLAGGARLPGAEDRPGAGRLRGPHLPGLPAASDPGLGRPGVLHPGAAVPEGSGHGLTTYQVVAALQLLLACWAGRCPLCRTPLPPPRHTRPAPT
ncbi:hypothetical protein GCM10027073_47400 [Streptomyces chlorus]